MSGRPRVLVKEKIAQAGVDLLKSRFDVDIGIDWSTDRLRDEIGLYDAVVIRSATKMTGDLIERGERLKVIGRAGVGVDNVDLEVATKRGVVVANAPDANTVAAAEHAMALMLAVCRNVPRAHGSLSAGKWERSTLGGIELYQKTLGVLGFGRIGRLVAQRAQAFEMDVLAYDPFVGVERYRELGVTRAETPEEIYAKADILTLHLPKTPETESMINRRSIARMKDGVRIVNAARGELMDLDALKEALDSGKVAQAALDVFPNEPMTDHAILSDPNVVVTPHLGASTVEAQDRAGMVIAEQVTAALEQRVVSNAVNIPVVARDDRAVVEPFLPLAAALGGLGFALAPHTSVDRIEVAYYGHLAERDTRLLTVAVLNGAFKGRVEGHVNLVNAPAIAEDRGIHVSESKDSTSEDFTNLLTVTVESAGERVTVGGTTFGPRHLPHLVLAYGRSVNIELAPNMAFFRYLDVPGMIGKVGTVFGGHSINIASTAVGREAEDGQGDRAYWTSSNGRSGTGLPAVMCVTTDQPVPKQVIDEILTIEGFKEGHAVELGALPG